MAKAAKVQSTYPTAGSAAPAFTAPASNGKTVKLSDFKGRVVALYFYPKDDTSGCTKEACGFRDSHQKFITKYDLPFLLLSDPEHKICEAYGVWQQKSMYGRKYMGVARTTFLIDGAGNILHVFEKVKPAGHDEEVLTWISGNASRASG